MTVGRMDAGFERAGMHAQRVMEAVSRSGPSGVMARWHGHER